VCLWNVADNYTAQEDSTWSDWYAGLDQYTAAVKGDWLSGIEWEPVQWSDGEWYTGLSESISEESCAAAREIVSANLTPNTALYLEQYVFEQQIGDRDSQGGTDPLPGYPDDYPHWQLDEDGDKMTFWPGTSMMDITHTAYMEHIRARLVARYQCLGSGDLDNLTIGTFIDNIATYNHLEGRTEAWVSLLSSLREDTPESPLLVNVGWGCDTSPLTPYASVMFEDSLHHIEDEADPADAWVTDTTTLFYIYNDSQSVREGVNEVFGDREDVELVEREYVRTLLHTSLGFRYADSTDGHHHIWYPIYDAALGPRVADPVYPVPSLMSRRYDQGEVAYCPVEVAEGCELATHSPGRRMGVWGWEGEAGVSQVSLSPGEGCVFMYD
ncbi:hypothetical protein KIPB_012332, partial [Kipferlia bialata]